MKRPADGDQLTHPASFFVRNNSAAVVVVAHAALLPDSPSLTMIAIQKPPHMFSSPMLRPVHSRASSASVVVKPTHTPGLLTLSKPAHPVLRPQTAQQHQRSVRASPRAKAHPKSPQPAQALAHATEESKKTAAASKADVPTTPEKANAQQTGSATSDKPPRGRQSNKSSKDKAQRRASSSSRAPARRPPHQSSPPPMTRLSSQAEVSVSQRSPKLSRPTASIPVSDDPNDPFIDHESTRDPARAPVKAGAKGSTFHPPPALAQPSGKLARRRQQASRAGELPISKLTPTRKERIAALVGSLSDNTSTESLPDTINATPSRRGKGRRVPVADPVADWDSFPVCDDSADQADDSDDTPPTSPIRETASVPAKKTGRTWPPVDNYNDAPHTAPLSSTFGFPFPSPTSTPTPAQRRRNHKRAPSEGVFHMSMDEDSSSSEALPSIAKMSISGLRRKTPSEIRQARANTIEGAHAASAPQLGFFAGSMFQNSPSPEELPPPPSF